MGRLAAVRVLALDYGPARTGVAVSDPTGTVARPLEVVARADDRPGLERIVELARTHEAERIVVGLPLTPSGARGEQAARTEEFVARLREATALPVETFDERFTTRLAARRRSEGTPTDEDALAAAYLLSDFLTWTTART